VFASAAARRFLAVSGSRAQIAVRDLAHASGVSLPTIKRLESAPGILAAHSSTVAALRRALESAGIEFTKGNGPGVHLKAAS
jgi:predicted transcriptional regulator